MHNDFVLNPNPDVAFYRAARSRVVDFFPSGLTSSRSAVVLTAEASILDASTLLRFADFVSCTQDRPEKSGPQFCVCRRSATRSKVNILWKSHLRMPTDASGPHSPRHV